MKAFEPGQPVPPTNFIPAMPLYEALKRVGDGEEPPLDLAINYSNRSSVDRTCRGEGRT